MYRITVSLLTLLTLLLLFIQPLHADRGTLPMIDVNIYGSGQKAIIAWNGETELLILSTDLYASVDTKVLEVMPLPSRPNVEEGSLKSFENIQNLMMKNLRSTKPEYKAGLELVFHEKIGVHDITVVKSTSIKELSRFIIDYAREVGLKNTPSIGEASSAILEDYLNRGFNYFALDLVDLNSTTRTVEPIIYEFKTPSLYYPMKISKTAKGNTRITLYLITPDPISEDNIPSKMQLARYLPSDITIQFQLSTQDLESIDPKIVQLLNGGAWLTTVKYEGDLNGLDFDMEIQPYSTSKPKNIRWLILVGSVASSILLGAFLLYHYARRRVAPTS
ncbi:MAG: DUF2330 domain-containing protein [Candidatus Bathyarchaeia archaeon]